MLPNLTRVGILIDFKINQDFIAKVLCINKDKPELKCNGKCHLTKQLKKVEEPEEKQAPNNTKDKREIVYFLSHSIFEIRDSGLLNEKKTFILYASDFQDASFISDIFHPPRLGLI